MHALVSVMRGGDVLVKAAGSAGRKDAEALAKEILQGELSSAESVAQAAQRVGFGCAQNLIVQGLETTFAVQGSMSVPDDWAGFQDPLMSPSRLPADYVHMVVLPECELRRR